MDFLTNFSIDFIRQLQSPTLSFLIGGMIVVGLGTRLVIPDAIVKIIIFMLLARIGLNGGIAIRNSNLTEMILPAIFSVTLGILIVLIARFTLAKLPNVRTVDALATGGLFGAVSGSTMAASLTLLEEQNIPYEEWAGALYPFMDIPALVMAIVVANIHVSRQMQKASSDPLGQEKDFVLHRVKIWPIIQESLQGSALTSMLLGIALGIFARPESVYQNFFDPAFRGLLSILMLVMGMEAWSRLSELRKVAQWYVFYSVVGPFVHGLIAFGLGMIAHYTTGFSLGGVVVLAVIASSSSDISGPPTLRAGIPSANPSAYIGASTAIGTPIAIGVCIPFFLGLAQTIGGIPPIP
ncbi:MAG: sodium-dependent bicarbonate transport family permease [Thermostichus sp. DG02_5_bins_236]